MFPHHGLCGELQRAKAQMSQTYFEYCMRSTIGSTSLWRCVGLKMDFPVKWPIRIFKRALLVVVVGVQGIWVILLIQY